VKLLGGSEAIAVATQKKPDVVVLDYCLPLFNGLHVARKLRRRLPSTEILIFTMHYCGHFIEDAIRSGVRGYVLKSGATRDLIPAINAVAAHGPYLTDKVVDSLIHRLRNRRISALRNQERRQSSRSTVVRII
jgi:DNA-binding NarL/FixJ family response regulator